jgi:hypothetical protein
MVRKRYLSLPRSARRNLTCWNGISSLCTWLLFREDDDQTKKGENMYLKLNALIRNQFFQADAASKADWMDVLAMIRDNLDCLFYYLTINLALCKLDQLRSPDHESMPSFPPSQITLVKSGVCLTQKEHLKALLMAQNQTCSTAL